MKFLSLSLSLSLIFLSSCDKDNIIFKPGENQINLQSPGIEQTNYYLRFSGTCGDLQPTGDTLVLRIKSFDGINMLLEESFTDGSPIHFLVPFEYPAVWKNDILEIEADVRGSSSLFYFFGSDSLKLTMSPASFLHQDNCLVWNDDEEFIGDYIGRIPQFRIDDYEYKDKRVVSCVPEILNLDGYLLYDANNLYASFTSFEDGWSPDPQTTIEAYALINPEE
ncbi:MAG: hypothetical protein H7Y42_09485 [Chitinophagaceae bacterium]|nr:hypothetical protein [Chitinophagaceae bacterium]